MDTLSLEGLEVLCVVGVRPDERNRQQRVVVDVALGLDARRAARTGRIAHTVDYDQVAREVAALLQFRQYGLLEAAAEEVTAFLLGAHPLVEEVRVRLAKPEALEGRARAACLQLGRRREDLLLREARVPGATLSMLLETGEARLAVASVEPGASLEQAWLGAGPRLDVVVSGEVMDGDRGLPPGTLSQSGSAYRNRGAATAVLCSCVRTS